MQNWHDTFEWWLFDELFNPADLCAAGLHLGLMGLAVALRGSRGSSVLASSIFPRGRGLRLKHIVSAGLCVLEDTYCCVLCVPEDASCIVTATGLGENLGELESWKPRRVNSL